MIFQGNIPEVTGYIKTGMRVNFAKTKYGDLACIALSIAVESGNLALASLLLGAGANPFLLVQYCSHRPPSCLAFKEACDEDFKPFIDLVFENDPKSALSFFKGEDGAEGPSLFVSAASNGCKILALLIAKGVDPNSQDRFGNTALHVTQDPKTLKLLLETGANPNIQNHNGISAFLRYAMQFSILCMMWWDDNSDQVNTIFEVLDLFLKCGAYINLANKYGNTALHEASFQKDSKPLVEWLLEHDADPTLKNLEGVTAKENFDSKVSHRSPELTSYFSSLAYNEHIQGHERWNGLRGTWMRICVGMASGKVTARSIESFTEREAARAATRDESAPSIKDI
jgi:hypothetical protein